MENNIERTNKVQYACDMIGAGNDFDKELVETSQAEFEKNIGDMVI